MPGMFMFASPLSSFGLMLDRSTCVFESSVCLGRPEMVTVTALAHPTTLLVDWAKDSVAIVLLPIKEKVVAAMSNIPMNNPLKLLLVFINLSILSLLKFIRKLTRAHIKGCDIPKIDEISIIKFDLSCCYCVYFS